MSTFFLHAKKIDLFGKPFIFEEKENQKFTTIFGLISTVVIIITCIIISFLFGKEIYQRKNPSVVNSEERIDNSFISMKDFPMLYAIHNGSGKNMPQATKHLLLRTTHMYYDENLKSNYTVSMGFEKCDVSKFNSKYQSMIQNFYDTTGKNVDLYCFYVKDDMSIQNDYGTANSIMLNIRFMFCDVYYGVTCGPIDERNEIMNDLYISIFYVAAYIDSSTYDNPINYYMNTISQKLSEGLLQRYFIDIEKLNFISHNGWLLEDKQYTIVNKLKSMTIDVSTAYYGNLYWITLSSPKIRTKIERTYMKVQDMLAKIGGFFNALYISILIISKNFINFSFIKYIYNHFCVEDYKIDNTFKNSSMNSLEKQNTINKLVIKMAYNNIYPTSEDNNNKNKSSFMRFHSSNAMKDHKEIKTKNNLIGNNINIMNNNNSINKLNNDFLNNNNASKLNISNNALNNIRNNEASDSSNEVGRKGSFVNKKINNYVFESNNNGNDVKKETSKKESNKNSENNVNKMDSAVNIKNLNNFNKEPQIEMLNKSNLSNIPNIPYFYNDSNLKTYVSQIGYTSYLWNDIVCCRNKFLYQRKAVEKVISFENLVEVSYDYFLKNNKE